LTSIFRKLTCLHHSVTILTGGVEDFNNDFSGPALQLLAKDVISVLGPQSSAIARVISHAVNELHVPLISFAASDPTLSSLEYSYFVRATLSDYYQMGAIASIVTQYQWKEVIAIYVDDDYGRGGITALGDALAQNKCKITYKTKLPPGLQRLQSRIS
jgi:glutamate receptor, ionotropic, plant